MRVWGLLEEDEELVLEDGFDLTETAIERSFLNRLDDGAHGDSVMVLIHYDGRLPLKALSRDSSRFEGDSSAYLRESDHLDAILVSQHLKSVRLDLQHETKRLIVLEKDQVTSTIQFSNGLAGRLLST